MGIWGGAGRWGLFVYGLHDPRRGGGAGRRRTGTKPGRGVNAAARGATPESRKPFAAAGSARPRRRPGGDGELHGRPARQRGAVLQTHSSAFAPPDPTPPTHPPPSPRGPPEDLEPRHGARRRHLVHHLEAARPQQRRVQLLHQIGGADGQHLQGGGEGEGGWVCRSVRFQGGLGILGSKGSRGVRATATASASWPGEGGVVGEKLGRPLPGGGGDPPRAGAGGGRAPRRVAREGCVRGATEGQCQLRGGAGAGVEGSGATRARIAGDGESNGTLWPCRIPLLHCPAVVLRSYRRTCSVLSWMPSICTSMASSALSRSMDPGSPPRVLRARPMAST